jgi:hypothetical protein
MINPLIKNCRTGFHDDVLNRTSHYKKLLESRPKIDTQIDRVYLSHSHKQVGRPNDDGKGEENLRILRKLMAIERESSRYRTESSNFPASPKKTLKNYYRERQRSLMVSEDNVRLLKKIGSIESDISLKKLDAFHHGARRHPRNADELKKVTMIDDFYYKSFRVEQFRGRIESKMERLNNKRLKEKNKQQNRYRYETLNAYEELKASVNGTQQS